MSAVVIEIGYLSGKSRLPAMQHIYREKKRHTERERERERERGGGSGGEAGV